MSIKNVTVTCKLDLRFEIGTQIFEISLHCWWLFLSSIICSQSYLTYRHPAKYAINLNIFAVPVSNECKEKEVGKKDKKGKKEQKHLKSKGEKRKSLNPLGPPSKRPKKSEYQFSTSGRHCRLTAISCHQSLNTFAIVRFRSTDGMCPQNQLPDFKNSHHGKKPKSTET